MSNGYFKVEMPKNEPVKDISSGKPRESQLKERAGAPVAQVVQVPMIIGGRKFGQRERPKQYAA